MYIEFIGLAGSGKTFLINKFHIKNQSKSFYTLRKYFHYFIYFFKFFSYIFQMMFLFLFHFFYIFKFKAFISFFRIFFIRPFYLYYLVNNTKEKFFVIEDGIFQGILSLYNYYPKIDIVSLFNLYFKYFPKVSLVVNLNTSYKVINNRLLKRKTIISATEFLKFEKFKNHICIEARDKFGISIFSYQTNSNSSKSIYRLKSYIKNISRFN
jgi:hypothetical protein